jgi:hypothetical protein
VFALNIRGVLAWQECVHVDGMQQRCVYTCIRLVQSLCACRYVVDACLCSLQAELVWYNTASAVLYSILAQANTSHCGTVRYSAQVAVGCSFASGDCVWALLICLLVDGPCIYHVHWYRLCQDHCPCCSCCCCTITSWHQPRGGWVQQSYSHPLMRHRCTGCRHGSAWGFSGVCWG